MKNRKGEIATLLTVGTLVVIGIATVVSSLNLGKKTSTNTRAGSTCPATATDQKTGDASKKTCSDICGSYSNFGGVQWVSTDGKTRTCCCKNATTPVALADPNCPAPNQVKSGSGDCSVQCGGASNWTGAATADSTSRKCCCKPAAGTTDGPCVEKTCSDNPNQKYWWKYPDSSGKYAYYQGCTTPIPNLTDHCKITTAPEKTCATGTHLTGVPKQQNCSMVCEAKGGLYISSTQWNSENDTVLNCCCKNIVSPGTDTPQGPYPQNNNGRTEGMACCFLQNGKVRVYASATARANNGMNTPCTTAVYGNTYGATSWFECPNDTVDGGAQADYEAANALPPTTCTVTGYAKTILNDGKYHCVSETNFARCGDQASTYSTKCGDTNPKCVDDVAVDGAGCKPDTAGQNTGCNPAATATCPGTTATFTYYKSKATPKCAGQNINDTCYGTSSTSCESYTWDAISSYGCSGTPLPAANVPVAGDGSVGNPSTTIVGCTNYTCTQACATKGMTPMIGAENRKVSRDKQELWYSGADCDITTIVGVLVGDLINCSCGVKQVVAPTIPTRITVAFKNSCKDHAILLSSYAPAGSGYYYNMGVSLEVGKTSTPIDISAHCSSWGILSTNNAWYIPKDIDCTMDGKQKDYTYIMSGDWCGGL